MVVYTGCRGKKNGVIGLTEVGWIHLAENWTCWHGLTRNYEDQEWQNIDLTCCIFLG